MKLKIGLALLGAIAAVGIAIAQVPTPAIRVPVAQNDLVQIVPNGAPNGTAVYVTAGTFAGVDQYSYQVPLTAFTITVPNATTILYLNPAGTLATGTLTMMAQPADGQRFSLESSQTQTAITISANTGQTFASGTFGLTTPTALVANTVYTWRYFAPLAQWVRTS